MNLAPVFYFEGSQGLYRYKVWVTVGNLRWEREYEGGGTLPPGHCTAKALRLEVPELLHEVTGLHEGHVSEVQVAEDLVLKPPGSLLVRTS